MFKWLRRKRPRISTKAPFYMHIPSARICITDCLSKWFVHALEARGDESTYGQINTVRKEIKPAGKEAEVLTILTRQLRNRKLLGKCEQFKPEIHFVIADNAPFYENKPIGETHSPEAARIANLLNSIGNRYGIFIHYITADHMADLMPETIPEVDPHFSMSGGGRIVTGIGGASNIALSYIKGFHQRYYPSEKEAHFLRMSDDVFPPEGKVKWRKVVSVARHRNFFRDQQKIMTGTRTPKEYRGYFAYLGKRKRRIRDQVFAVRSMPLAEMPYYPTAILADVNYPGTKGMRVYRTPPWIIHAGGRSSWFRLHDDVSGGGFMENRKRKVEPVPVALVEKVIGDSGITITEGRERKS